MCLSFDYFSVNAHNNQVVNVQTAGRTVREEAISTCDGKVLSRSRCKFVRRATFSLMRGDITRMKLSIVMLPLVELVC